MEGHVTVEDSRILVDGRIDGVAREGGLSVVAPWVVYAGFVRACKEEVFVVVLDVGCNLCLVGGLASFLSVILLVLDTTDWQCVKHSAFAYFAGRIRYSLHFVF